MKAAKTDLLRKIIMPVLAVVLSLALGAVIIAAAGKAAHLAGVLAGHTTLPVIGVPMKASVLDGMDALLATVQMPKGVPVATVAIDGADNAALLAAQILAVSEPTLADKLEAQKQEMARQVLEKDKKLQAEAAAL